MQISNRILLLLIVASTCFSCTQMKVTTHRQYIKNDEIKKIALFQVLITKPFQPVLPLIDAAAFNNKTNKLADEIMDAEKKRVDVFRETLAKNMAFKYNAEILYGKVLQELPNYETLKKKLENKNGLNTNNDHFPIIIKADGEFNAFAYEKGKVEQFFGNSEYKNEIKTICTDLEVDAVAINVSYLNFQNVTSFGISCSARLNSALYIIGKNGNTKGLATGYSKIVSVRGKKIEEYELILDEFTILLPEIAEQLVNPKSK